MKTIHVYNKGDIMRRAHKIARDAREAKARAAWEDSRSVVCGRYKYTMTLKACLAATPVDFSAAMKQAWAEAKGVESLRVDRSRALVVVRNSFDLAPMRRRFRISRVLPLLARIARFVSSRYIGRAA
ncbi:hypothetical protein CCR94_16455 [Rhodoblastus sphagnicola]|uniref:Uncharacterized protein n=1 Tax=Rhodoblastus sphagnicola TaxID=333368 RepID=A0A2S6N2Y3_9HYPH|nr:hypothetical protein [Rhodoblastus sphagnicola]MBB4199089.1 hypothetical protein [Rhodoblastus sphagnicola]PPQ28981.1 hypothetical protein CCR94_16455 [Rhodoblastus sphagnicola]